MTREEQIQRILHHVELMRRSKLSWKKIAIQLFDRGLGPPGGGVWTIDSLIAFYHAHKEGKQ
jgi:hypothetical protein